MFLKRIVRRSRGKTLSYWALVESYRTARGPRHRIVSYLGELTATQRKELGGAGGAFSRAVAVAATAAIVRAAGGACAGAGHGGRASGAGGAGAGLRRGVAGVAACGRSWDSTGC